MKEKLEELLNEATQKVEQGDLEGAKALLAEISQLKAEAEQATEQTEPVQETPVEDEEQAEQEAEEVTEEEISDAVEDLAEAIKDKEEEEEQKETSEKRSKGDLKMKEIKNPNQEQRSAVADFDHYLRKPHNTSETRGLTKVEGGVLVPQDISTTPVQKPKYTVDLRDLVSKVPVTRGSGKYPVLLSADASMISVAELQANPSLANPSFVEVNYDIDTYRGTIPVSMELIEDSDYDVQALVMNHLNTVTVNTANKEICANLKTFKAKAVEKLADIKKIINVDLDPSYDVQVVINQTMFNELDQEVATDGRALLQPDSTKASNYSILGREVIIVPDIYLGAVGEAHAFIGDIKRAVTFFDRKQATVSWVDNETYGKRLACYVRFDAVKVDEDAGVFVTKTLAP